MDAGAKPTGMYSRRVSEQGRVSHIRPEAIRHEKRAAISPARR